MRIYFFIRRGSWEKFPFSYRPLREALGGTAQAMRGGGCLYNSEEAFVPDSLENTEVLGIWGRGNLVTG
jgi:hypothetical protein